MAEPPLGWIEPKKRTREQKIAHDAASAALGVKYALPARQLKKGQAVKLYDAWNHPDVLADTKIPFRRIWQKTGSCVWAGGSCALFTSIAMQRLAGVSPTKAFIPFTLHNYAMSRHYFGDDSRGEGSLGSTFWKSLHTDGVVEWPPDPSDDLPDWKIEDDAFSMTSSDELNWSTYRNPKLQSVLARSKEHTAAATGECTTVEDIHAMLTNGYGVSFACNNFVGSGKIVGSGSTARVMGKWGGRGGHQQSVLAVEEHENLGPIYWAQNNWQGSTYPKCPSGAPTCGVWVLEKDVKAALRLSAEVYGLSNIKWFPAQPAVVDWGQM